MITNRDIIIFADDWGRYPSTAQHIGKILLKQNKIFWIGSFGLRKPKFHFKDFKRIFEKGKKIIKQKENSEVVEINPLIIPFHDSKIISLLNNYLVTQKLKKSIAKYNLKNIILITTNPLISTIIKKFNFNIKIYLCLDDWSKFDGAFSTILKKENDLISNVDLVISTSNELFEQKKSIKNNLLISQGVDQNHFNANGEIDINLNKIKKPVVGFFGLIAHWIDLDLIIKSAIELPDFEFIIIGKYSPEVSEKKLPTNINFLGEISFQNLPNFARKFNVGIIPFCVNELTKAVNPLKLLEYFSFGIPVVSTNLVEVSKMGDLVYIANDEKDFIEKIKIAVNEKDEIKKNKRIEIARNNSWEKITEQISQKILEIEECKN